jgi:uncharacterized integral membrane protein
MTFKKMYYLVLIAILVIFILQNIASVTVSFLFWEFTLPRAIILSVTFGLGVLTGLGIFEILHHKNKSKKLRLNDRR